MARVSILIAFIGGFLFIFTPWAMIVEIVAFLLALVAMVQKPKSKDWIFALVLSLLYIIFPVYVFIASRNDSFRTPNWYYIPSAAGTNVEPNYYLKNNNFNFDSMMVPPQDIDKVELTSSDTSIGPDLAPMD